jgi:hypothetical protein
VYRWLVLSSGHCTLDVVCVQVVSGVKGALHVGCSECTYG